MSIPLRVLHLEDNADDALLIENALYQGGFAPEISRVDTQNEFRAVIERREWDIVISDYTLPGWNGIDALELCRQYRQDIPFIFVSGTIGEDKAVQAMKNGANDYMIKGNIKRLIPTIQRELREAKVRDESKKTKEELIESEQRFQTFMDHTPTVVFIENTEGKLMYVNAAWLTSFGKKREEAIGQSMNAFFPEEIAERLRSIDKEVLTTDKPLSYYEKMPTVDGVMREWFMVKFPLLINDQKRFMSTVAIDVTEKRQLEAQIYRKQRLESIGMLASGIAHDLNNVLAPIQLGIQLLKQRMTDEDIKVLESMESSASRGVSIIKQILSFARGGIEGEKKPVFIKQLLSEMEKIVFDSFSTGIHFRRDIANNLWLVEGNPTQLYQVLINLCVNARDAMPDGGTLFIEAKNVVIDEHYSKMHVDARPGPYVMLTVTDSGTGIPTDVMNKIFDPFFTTKAPGKGTGLGLFTVHRIVKDHGGFINVYTEEGKGTRFRIYLPVVETTTTYKDEQENSNPVGHGETVLIIDDDQAVREVTKSTLEAYGYQVEMAKDGKEAVAQFSRQKENIQVVLTDMMMPNMDGVATIHAIRKINPDMKFIVMSGLIDNYRNLEVLAPQSMHFLEKPFTTQKLLVTLSKTIEKS